MGQTTFTQNVVTLGTTPIPVVTGNPDRIGIIFSFVNGESEVVLGPGLNTATNCGVLLTLDEPVFQVWYQQSAGLATLPWMGIAALVASKVSVIEVIVRRRG